jgi:hypothetical protein
VRKVALISLALLAALLVLTAPAAAAQTEIQPAEEELTLYLHAPGHYSKHVLWLTVYARQGVATILSEPDGREIENDLGVAYVTRMRKGPLDGRLDVRFPHLGHIVGRIVPKVGSENEGTSHGCGGRSESGTFVGSVDFRGSGGYGVWRARHAAVTISRGGQLPCIPRSDGSLPKTLFGYVTGYGPGFSAGSDGPFSFLDAGIPGRRRGTEFFAAIYGRGPGETVTFTALDYEWLAGGVACERWAQLSGAPRGDLFEIAPGAAYPPSATLKPPAPFSGEATYSRKGHTFLGDLGVHMLGRTVRLAGSGAAAFLANQH